MLHGIKNKRARPIFGSLTLDYSSGIQIYNQFWWREAFIYFLPAFDSHLGLVLCYTATCWYNLNKMTGATRRKGKLGGWEPSKEATAPQNRIEVFFSTVLTSTSWVFKTPPTLSAVGICPFDPADIVCAGFHLQVRKDIMKGKLPGCREKRNGTISVCRRRCPLCFIKSCFFFN